MKRFRMPKAKPKELKVCWGNSHDMGEDIYYCWGDGCSKRDGGLLHTIFSAERPPVFHGERWQKSLTDELKARGYDITTFKFSIKKLG